MSEPQQWRRVEADHAVHSSRGECWLSARNMGGQDEMCAHCGAKSRQGRQSPPTAEKQGYRGEVPGTKTATGLASGEVKAFPSERALPELSSPTRVAVLSKCGGGEEQRRVLGPGGGCGFEVSAARKGQQGSGCMEEASVPCQQAGDKRSPAQKGALLERTKTRRGTCPGRSQGGGWAGRGRVAGGAVPHAQRTHTQARFPAASGQSTATQHTLSP